MNVLYLTMPRLPRLSFLLTLRLSSSHISSHLTSHAHPFVPVPANNSLKLPLAIAPASPTLGTGLFAYNISPSAHPLLVCVLSGPAFIL